MAVENVLNVFKWCLSVCDFWQEGHRNMWQKKIARRNQVSLLNLTILKSLGQSDMGLYVRTHINLSSRLHGFTITVDAFTKWSKLSNASLRPFPYPLPIYLPSLSLLPLRPLPSAALFWFHFNSFHFFLSYDWYLLIQYPFIFPVCYILFYISAEYDSNQHSRQLCFARFEFVFQFIFNINQLTDDRIMIPIALIDLVYLPPLAVCILTYLLLVCAHRHRCQMMIKSTTKYHQIYELKSKKTKSEKGNEEKWKIRVHYGNRTNGVLGNKHK